MDPQRQWADLLAGDDEWDWAATTLDWLEREEPEPDPGALAGVVESVAVALVVAPDDADRTTLLDPLERLHRASLTTAPTGAYDVIALGAVAVVLEVSGREVDPPAVVGGPLRDLVASGRYDDDDVTSLALLAAACGFDDLVQQLAGSNDTFVPDELFGPDAQGFARAVVAGADHEATGVDIAPAWTSYVAYFPAQLDTGWWSWCDLVFGARGVYVRLNGQSPSETLDELRGFVRAIAAG